MEKPNFYSIKYIEQYLNGTLQKEDLQEFERQIELDSKLKAKIEEVKQLPEDLLHLEKERLKDGVKEWMDAERKPNAADAKVKSPLTIRFRRILKIAAVFALIGAALWMFPFTNNLDAKTQAYLTEYHQNPIVLRGSNDDNWELAIENYTSRDFKIMINEMEGWIDDKNGTTEQWFYFALAHFYDDNDSDDKVLEYFSKIEQRDPLMFKEEIAWYRALIFIQRQQNEAARVELMKIESTNRYSEKAKDLLKSLK